MRFDIGPGGGFLILVGLLGLSAAVFFLGMISGREMAQTEQGQTQLASVYPMPAGAPAAPPQAAAPEAAAPIAAATAKPPSHEDASREASSTEQSAAAPAPAAVKPARAPKAPPPRPTLASAPIQHPAAPAAEYG